MKILHLFSNWKWTGPAEPALDLCVSLGRRHETAFISGSHPRSPDENEVARHAREKGIDPVGGFHLDKHFHPIHNLEDIVKLRRLLREKEYDAVHSHMANDHFIAACASRRLRPRPRIVRSFYDAGGPPRSMRTRWLLRHYTDGAVVISDRARKRLANVCSLPSGRVAVILGGVDTARFDPAGVDRRATRGALGLGKDDFVFGIVARMQRHRKFGVLLQAFARALEDEPRLRLVIVGRGTHQEEVARSPARAMGLGERVVFAGYLQGRAFVETLGAMDCALFLVPGSDGSCRAVREKMSMALPVIAARTPPLDEMIVEGKTGSLVEPDVSGLAAAMIRAAGNREGTAAMGRRSREKALAEFSLEVQAGRVEELYRTVTGG